VIVLAGTVRIAPGMREKALPHILTMVEASRAEPGCLEYGFAFDVMDDHLVRIFECFVDDEAREVHRNSPHMEAWRASWAEAGIGDRAMMRYVVTERGTT
jgi:quinol monooxygenase YgiN